MLDEYKQNLIKGLEYQDFITDILAEKLGINLIQYVSQKWQYEKGENKQGIEIKYDDRYKETNNIYIEIAEKTNPQNKEYIKSGIYRNDNSWLYLIGNYEVIYIFSIKFLRLLHKKEICREVDTPTSKGFLLTENEGKQYAIKIICL